MLRERQRPENEGERFADGRVRRGQHNREKILQAIYELVRENQTEPTALQVAARAQVGARTVFRHFADMDALRSDMQARVQSEIVPLLLEEVSTEGDLPTRLEAIVRKRSRIFDHLAPFRRAGATNRAQTEEGRAQLAQFLRRELKQVLAPELKNAPTELLEAVDLLASFEAWERLRRDQHLGRERAQKVVLQTLLALVEER